MRRSRVPAHLLLIATLAEIFLLGKSAAASDLTL